MNPSAQTEPSPTLPSELRDATARLAAAGIESARLDAEILLASALGIERRRLYLNGAPLDGTTLARFRALVARRANGEPDAYIIGRREFSSLDSFVTPAVLTPRPETELLVETAVRLYEAESQISNRRLQILDLGTGSGAIAVALAKEIARATIVATDISLDALEVARGNARRHGVE